MPHKVRQPAAYRVKPRSRIGHVRFAKLKALGCFKDVHARIIEGWPLSQVAKFIQVDRKEYTDVTPASLVSVLQEYRGTIPPGTLLKETPLLPIYNKVVDEVEQGLNELEELEKLYRMQLERLETDRKIEKEVKKLLTSMNPEMRLAKDLLLARSQLKMDLGLTNRHLGTAEVEVNVQADLAQQFGSEAVQKTLSNDESRRKLLGIADRVVALAQSPRAQALAGLGASVGKAVVPESGREEDLLPDSLVRDPGAVPDEEEAA